MLIYIETVFSPIRRTGRGKAILLRLQRIIEADGDVQSIMAVGSPGRQQNDQRQAEQGELPAEDVADVIAVSLAGKNTS